MKERSVIICRQTAAQLRDRLTLGDVTSREIVNAFLESIAEKDGMIHAFLEVYAEDALAQAAASDTRRQRGELLSPLDGIPIALKDNLLTQGHLCTCASRMLANFVAPYDATVVRKLKKAGMPILGRTNMDEFSMGERTETSVFGGVRNPIDLSRVAGGSSGGSAAAVAAGMAPLALGSDTGGSVRQPAAFCGIVGVKPAYGTISRYGMVAFSNSMDQIGTLTKTAEDAALLLRVIAGHDPLDATSSRTPPADFASKLGQIDGLELAMPEECKGMSPAVARAFAQGEEKLKALGIRLKSVSLPSWESAFLAWYTLACAEASSNLARFDGIRYGHRAEDAADLAALYRKTRSEGFGAEVQKRILWGAISLSGKGERYYEKARIAQAAFCAELDEVLSHCDGLYLPATHTTAYPFGQAAPEMNQGDRFMVPANLTGLPALSTPCGLAEDGLPVGMQLMGARDSLPLLLGIAAAYEGGRP